MPLTRSEIEDCCKNPSKINPLTGSRHFHKIFSGWNTHLIQPDLKISLKEDTEVANAYFKVYYSKHPFKHLETDLWIENTWTNTYSLSDMTPEEIDDSLEDYGIYLWDHMNFLQEDEDYDMSVFKF